MDACSFGVVGSLAGASPRLTASERAAMPAYVYALIQRGLQ
jgi:hypothetical protein